jgi:hypothetical protein
LEILYLIGHLIFNLVLLLLLLLLLLLKTLDLKGHRVPSLVVSACARLAAGSTLPEVQLLLQLLCTGPPVEAGVCKVLGRRS